MSLLGDNNYNQFSRRWSSSWGQRLPATCRLKIDYNYYRWHRELRKKSFKNLCWALWQAQGKLHRSKVKLLLENNIINMILNCFSAVVVPNRAICYSLFYITSHLKNNQYILIIFEMACSRDNYVVKSVNLLGGLVYE